MERKSVYPRSQFPKTLSFFSILNQPLEFLHIKSQSHVTEWPLLDISVHYVKKQKIEPMEILETPKNDENWLKNQKF